MTLEQINQLNEKFQKQAVLISELMPSGRLVEPASMIIRCARQIQKDFIDLLNVRQQYKFKALAGKMEDEMDDIIYVLDQLESANSKRKISIIDDFLKEGYGLMSIYSKCFDQVMEARAIKEDKED